MSAQDIVYPSHIFDLVWSFQRYVPFLVKCFETVNPEEYSENQLELLRQMIADQSATELIVLYLISIAKQMPLFVKELLPFVTEDQFDQLRMDMYRLFGMYSVALPQLKEGRRWSDWGQFHLTRVCLILGLL